MSIVVSALVTFATPTELELAKQFFSSVYHNRAWNQACVLLTFGVSDDDAQWFISRGVRVVACESIGELRKIVASAVRSRIKANSANPVANSPPNSTNPITPEIALSARSIFSPLARTDPGNNHQFSAWRLAAFSLSEYEVVIYSDPDCIVRGNLNHLCKTLYFAAVKTPGGGGFQSSLFAFRPKFVAHKYSQPSHFFSNARREISRISRQPLPRPRRAGPFARALTVDVCDSLLLRLFPDWVELSPVYNMLIWNGCSDFYYAGADISGIILRFAGDFKPWMSASMFYHEWSLNLARAGVFSVRRLRLEESWSPAIIAAYTQKLFSRRLRFANRPISFLIYRKLRRWGHSLRIARSNIRRKAAFFVVWVRGTF